MINVVYLVLVIVGGNGITSQSIPQANMAQCKANAAYFNEGSPNKSIVANGYLHGARTQKALCIVGTK